MAAQCLFLPLKSVTQERPPSSIKRIQCVIILKQLLNGEFNVVG